jgi:hypothetical protein
VCELFLRLRGISCKTRVIWDDINLQDEVQTANARLLDARTALLQQSGGETS